MKSLTIDASIVRGAQANTATGKLPPMSMDCFLLSHDGQIVATNGNSMYCARYSDDPGDWVGLGVLVRVLGNVPVSAHEVTFDFEREVLVTDNTKLFPMSVVGASADFPSYKKVLLEAKHEVPPMSAKLFNTSVLSLIDKTFGRGMTVSLTVRGPQTATRIEPEVNPFEELLLIMPIQGRG